jgi:hypothetical protein
VDDDGQEDVDLAVEIADGDVGAVAVVVGPGWDSDRTGRPCMEWMLRVEVGVGFRTRHEQIEGFQTRIVGAASEEAFVTDGEQRENLPCVYCVRED